MWLFAALIVVAMGGIAALAAGHGTPMAPAYDDRPDSTVPAAGRLAGDDLRRVRFSLAFRGYRMTEVDALLERLAGEKDREQERAATFARPVAAPAEAAEAADPAAGPAAGDGPVAEAPGVATDRGPFEPAEALTSDGGPPPV